MKKTVSIEDKEKIRNKIDISYPFITSYPHHAMLFSLLSNKKYCYPAYFNYYLQLVYYKRERLDFNIGFNIVEFLNNIPSIQYNKIERQILKKNNIDLVEFIKSSIDNGYCIFMLIDLYNIEQCKTYYHKRHFYHDVMLYGYDVEKNVFLIGEFFDHKKYLFYEINIDNILDDSYEFFDWLGGIRLYKIKEEPYSAFSFNIGIIKSELENYINSSISNCINLIDTISRNDDYIYGLNIYDELIGVCDYIMNDGFNQKFDLRTIYVLLDHKKILLFMIKELHNNNCLYDSNIHYCRMLEIENKLRLTLSLIIKLNITGNKSLFSKVKERLKEIKKLEEFCLKKMILDIGFIKDVSFTTGKVRPIDIMNFDNKKYRFSFRGNKLSLERKKKIGMKIFVDGDFVLQDDDSTDVIIDDISNSFHCVEIFSDEDLNGYINIDTDSLDMKIQNRSMIDIVQLSKFDEKLVFGKDGKIIYGDCYEYPSYLGGIKYTKAYLVLLSKISTDKRAIKKEQTRLGTEAYILNSDYFEVYMRICGKDKKKITMYFSDYEYLGRKIYIECYIMGSEKLVAKTDVIDLKDSTYITFEVYGDVKFKIVKVEGPDATLSAIYFN